MSSISAVSAPRPAAPAPQAAPVRGTDADGDNDGTQAKVAKAAPAPVQAIPPATATKGNSINQFA